MHDDHDRHDRFLIAALAAGDLVARALPDAQELVAACADCAELLADLRSIAAATAALPPLPRPTDFRLSPDTAERLGARGWRGLLVRLADSRFGFSRPLAVGLTTLGLVGAIAGSIPGAMGGFGVGAAPVMSNVGNSLNATEDQSNYGAGAGAAPSSAEPAPSPAVPAAGEPMPPSPAALSARSSGPTVLYPAATSAPKPPDTASAAPSAPNEALVATPSPQATTSGQDTSRGARTFGSGSTGPPGPPPLLVGSLVLLLVGLGILGAQWAATRLTNRSQH